MSRLGTVCERHFPSDKEVMTRKLSSQDSGSDTGSCDPQTRRDPLSFRCAPGVHQFTWFAGCGTGGPHVRRVKLRLQPLRGMRRSVRRSGSRRRRKVRQPQAPGVPDTWYVRDVCHYVAPPESSSSEDPSKVVFPGGRTRRSWGGRWRSVLSWKCVWSCEG